MQNHGPNDDKQIHFLLSGTLLKTDVLERWKLSPSFLTESEFLMGKRQIHNLLVLVVAKESHFS